MTSLAGRQVEVGLPETVRLSGPSGSRVLVFGKPLSSGVPAGGDPGYDELHGHGLNA